MALRTRFLLILFGIITAAMLVGVLLLLFPHLRPGGERFIFRERDGDTFRHQPGFVRPPTGNIVLEDFMRRKDADGFRLPRMTADFYPIIALGDSYTEGGQVPWVDVLAAALQTPVRNLGWRGLGTLHQVEVMRRYGNPDAKWVLVGYFEGNDLSNIRSAYEERAQTGRITIDLNSDANTAENTRYEIVTNPDDNYLYPLEHPINGASYELAYISDYIWWLNGSAETFQNSKNLQLLRDALEEIKEMAGAACVGLVYMPSKEHIYFPSADPNGNRRYVLQNSLSLHLDAEGWLRFGELAPIDFDALHANFENQRNAVRDVAQQTGWHFIDLTPAFQENVTHPTYYVYDSHWNQSGHNLAADTVAQYLEQEAAACPYQ